MNYYQLAGVMVATKPAESYLRAVAMAVLFGKNIDYFDDTESGTKFQMPFSLSNITDVSLTNKVYDSSAQGVNEYSDRPYALKGLVAVITSPVATTTWKKDLDNYISWEVSCDSGGTPAVFTIAVGICNSSLTESYTPFATVGNAVFYANPQKSNNPQVTQYGGIDRTPRHSAGASIGAAADVVQTIVSTGGGRRLVHFGG